jgi:hypothetical protein
MQHTPAWRVAATCQSRSPSAAPAPAPPLYSWAWPSCGGGVGDAVGVRGAQCAEGEPHVPLPLPPSFAGSCTHKGRPLGMPAVFSYDKMFCTTEEHKSLTSISPFLPLCTNYNACLLRSRQRRKRVCCPKNTRVCIMGPHVVYMRACAPCVHLAGGVEDQPPATCTDGITTNIGGGRRAPAHDAILDIRVRTNAAPRPQPAPRVSAPCNVGVA